MSSASKSRHLRETCDDRAKTLGSSMKDKICRSVSRYSRGSHNAIKGCTHAQTQLVRETCKGVLFEKRADKLMHKAKLGAGAEIQQVGQYPCALGARTVLEVLADLRQEEVLVIGGVTPVRLAVGRPRGSSGSGRRRRGSGDLLLIHVGGGRRHAGRRRPSKMPRLSHLVEARIGDGG